MPKRQCFEGLGLGFAWPCSCHLDATSITCFEQLYFRSSFRWQSGRTSPCCAEHGVTRTWLPRASATTRIRFPRPVWPVTKTATTWWWPPLQSSERTCGVTTHLGTRIRRFPSRAISSPSRRSTPALAKSHGMRGCSKNVRSPRLSESSPPGHGSVCFPSARVETSHTREMTRAYDACGPRQ